MKYDSSLLVRRSSFVAIALLLVSLSADASKPRLRLEHIDTTDFASDGTIRVYASIVELEGNVDDDRAAPTFTLKLNRKSVGRPVKMTQFQGSGDPLDLVLVVEASALYGPPKQVAPPPAPPQPKLPKGAKPPKPEKPKPAPKGKGAKAEPVTGKGYKLAKELLKQAGPIPLDSVKEAMKSLLDGLSPRARVLLIEYGDNMVPHTPFRSPQSLEGDVDDLSPDGEAGDLVLTSSVRHAVDELKKPRPDGKVARRLIVVISDGLNSQMDRATFKSLGDYAGKAHVPIHTIAFSPTDERGPLLNLGEISKRSNGTFRWAKSADELRGQIETLGDELNKQYVLTYKIEARSLEKAKFQLICEDLESNIYDPAGGPTPPPSRPLIPWWLWLVFVVIIGGGAGAFVLRRRQARPKREMKFSPYKTGGGAAPAQQQAAPAQPQHQPRVTQQPQGPVAAAPPAVTRGLLIVVSGALSGTRVDVGAQPVSIGKGPATLQITDDPTVSTRHAEVALSRGAFVLTDLGSTNGTFVNNQRITQPVRLSDGDLLRFGSTQMKFRTE
jgi:pSer/pThr/pTyr-binding forkhead associated (FHA) protein